jgi:uncharacterized protein VirK/YbjX
MTQLIKLHSGLTGKPGSMRYIRDSIKLSTRALLNRRHTRSWLELLNSKPVLGELVRSYPRLVQKIYRPYLSNTLDCGARLAALTTHYRFILKQGLGSLVLQAARAPVVLCDIGGKSGVVYQIQLRAVAIMEREGELVLQLSRDEEVVYSVAFSFFSCEQRLAIGIGCVQGPQGEDGLERIREATRELHGLRPKNLMLRLVRQIGHDYGCQRLILVGNRNRAVHGSIRKGQVFADYDTLWREVGAQARGNGDFELACEDLAPPDMEQIASKKRAEMRRRHETLTALTAAIRARLAGPAAKPAVAPAMAQQPAEAVIAC